MTKDDLITALEAADGPSRELDVAIWQHLNPHVLFSTKWELQAATPRYTASIDAADSLRDRDRWPILVVNDLGPVMGVSARLAVFDTSGDQPRPIAHDAQAKTEPAARCIAALKARA